MRILSLKRTAAWFVILGVFWAELGVRAQSQTNRQSDAVLLTFSGSLQIAPAGTTAWAPGQPNQVLHIGDQIRTGKNSRASIRMSNLSVVRVYETTTLEIKPPTKAEHNSVIDVKSGATYFFNRDKPQETEFQTPSASGAIRGTEFNLAVSEDGQTQLALLDGQVTLSNDAGSLELQTGEQATVDTGKAPKKTALISAVNVIQWTLYYPAILDLDELALASQDQQSLSSSLDAYRAGDLLQALANYPSDRAPASGLERVYNAQLLLAAGNVDGAQALLRQSAQDPRAAALADALLEMIAAVKGEPWNRTAPRTLATEWMAGSYQAQSHKDLIQALKMAQSAAAKSPNFGFAQERVAELEFGFGHTGPALAALNKSLAAAPRNAQALALRGFLAAAQNRITEARTYFDQAITTDGSLANGWLGRGLVRIRRGEVNDGRKDLEVAAALEPNRAFLRSYLGKAWSMDQPGQYSWNTHLATNELGLAMHWDPNDPTAWLYSALLNDQRNLINQALADLEHSQDLNNNRALFRSKFLLDQDAAVRSANLALIYQDAGLTDVGIREATKAVEDNYANYSAHLFLSDSYDALIDPKNSNLRYETAWENELLLANLLSPVSAGALSQNVSQQEYSSMFEADKLGISSQTGYWSQGAWMENASQYGRMGDLAYSLDGYYYSDRGWRPNDDFNYWDYSAKVKVQASPKDTLFVQAGQSQQQNGDVNQYYYNNNADTTVRQQEVQEPNLLFGYHRAWGTGNDTIFLYRYLDDTYSLTDPKFQYSSYLGAGPPSSASTFGTYYQDQLDLHSLELQHIFQTDLQRLIVGTRYQVEDHTTYNDIGLPPPSLFTLANGTVNTEFNRFTAYGYYQLRPVDSLRLTAGATYDNLRLPVGINYFPVVNAEEQRERLSPKLGIDWTPWERTRIRAAYTRSVSGLFNDSSTVIEPSEVAGFNQEFRTLTAQSLVPGSTFQTWSAAVDHQFKTRTYANIEGDLLSSIGDQRVGQLEGVPTPTFAGSDKQVVDFKEKDLTVNLDQLVANCLALGAAYRLTVANVAYANNILPNFGLPSTAYKVNNQSTLDQINLFANFYLPCGFFSQFQAQWWLQNDRGFVVNEPGDQFWQFNVFAGYRFPRRHVEVQVGVLNLGNRNYRLDPLTYYIDPAHERMFVANFKFNF
jgi:Tfp pilus assembly protein PilF